MRTLSTESTIVSKLVMPPLLLGGTGWLLLEARLPWLLDAAVGLLALGLAYSFASLKRVRLEADGALLVSNFRREVRVPLADIEGVAEPPLMRGPPLITLRLRSETPLGEAVTFIPADSTVRDELRRLVGAARPNDPRRPARSYEQAADPHSARSADFRGALDLRLALVGAIGVLAMIVFVIAPRRDRLVRLADGGATTRGVIREVGRVDAQYAPERPVFRLTVAYALGGRTYVVSDERNLFPRLFYRAQPGDSVPLLYLPDDPKVAAVVPLPDDICEDRPIHRNCR